MKNIFLVLMVLFESAAFGRVANNTYVMPPSGNLPVWGKLNLSSSSAVTGVLPPLFGGRGINNSAVVNVGISAAVVTSALVINVTDAGGSTPSATDQAEVVVRSSTATTGTAISRALQGALSLTIPATTTIGAGTSLTEVVYVYAIDSAGTGFDKLGVILTRPGQASLQTTAAITGGTSRTQMYSDAIYTNRPVRLIGAIQTQTSGSVWSSPTQISVVGINSVAQPFSQVLGNTPGAGAAGYGTVGTKIRRWTSVTTTGSDITYADSSTNGMTMTINTEGLYFATYGDAKSGGITFTEGISINSNQLSTSISAITQNTILNLSDSAGGAIGHVAVTFRGHPGDVVRTHNDGGPVSTINICIFRMLKIAD